MLGLGGLGRRALAWQSIDHGSSRVYVGRDLVVEGLQRLKDLCPFDC